MDGGMPFDLPFPLAHSHFSAHEWRRGVSVSYLYLHACGSFMDHTDGGQVLLMSSPAPAQSLWSWVFTCVQGLWSASDLGGKHLHAPKFSRPLKTD